MVDPSCARVEVCPLVGNQVNVIYFIGEVYPPSPPLPPEKGRKASDTEIYLLHAFLPFSLVQLYKTFVFFNLITFVIFTSNL